MIHVNYYTEWAAHNTVVAGGASSPIPHFKGGGGTKNIGKIELVAMEPMAKEKAISERYSFTDTKYFESSTQTKQRRTMAIVRVSDTTGYYVDIFRSDNPISNDYLFHNEGDQVLLYDEKGEQITLHQTSYPKTENDFPGLRFLTEAKTTNKYISSVKAQFIASESEDGSQRMDVWMPSSSNKYYYTAYAPVTKTVAAPYNHLPTPVLTMRTEGKDGAWKDPFIALFESSRENHQTVIQHGVSLENFLQVYPFAKLNHKTLPDGYISGLESMYTYYLNICMPDGRYPALNDASWGSARQKLKEGYSYFPERKDYLYVATSGKEGVKPSFTSAWMPWAGWYIMICL